MRRDHEALMHESACADRHACRQTTARGTKGSGNSQPTSSWLGKVGLGTPLPPPPMTMSAISSPKLAPRSSHSGRLGGRTARSQACGRSTRRSLELPCHAEPRSPRPALGWSGGSSDTARHSCSRRRLVAHADASLAAGLNAQSLHHASRNAYIKVIFVEQLGRRSLNSGAPKVVELRAS